MLKKILHSPVNFFMNFIYLPLNKFLSAFFNRFPMTSWLTPNRITYGRTFLCIPVVMLLFCHHEVYAALLVVLNLLLDLIDGVVARVHKQLGIHYDERYGAFIDANCDKIFNFVVWYTWFVLSIERSGFAWMHVVVLLGILLEAILLVTRVKMYYSPLEKTQIAATGSGKFKQTIEVLGTALLFICSKVGAVVLFCAFIFALESLYEKRAKQEERKEM